MRSLWDELNSSYVRLVCSCGALPKFIEDQQLFQYLNGLNDSYSTVKSVIMLMNPFPPISKAYSLLQQDESQREAQSPAPNFSSGTTSFLVSPASSSTNRNFTQKFNFETRKGTTSFTCKYCKKPDHSVDTCYKLHGFPPNFKFTRNKKSASCAQAENSAVVPANSFPQTSNSSAHGFTKEQYQHLLTLFQQAQMFAGHTSEATNVDNSSFAHFVGLFSRYDVASIDSHTCASSQLGVNPWILDTCATNHMTPHKHLLFNVQPLFKPFLVPSLKRPLEIGKAAGRLCYLYPDANLYPTSSTSMSHCSPCNTLPVSKSDASIPACNQSSILVSLPVSSDKSNQLTHLVVNVSTWYIFSHLSKLLDMIMPLNLCFMSMFFPYKSTSPSMFPSPKEFMDSITPPTTYVPTSNYLNTSFPNTSTPLNAPNSNTPPPPTASPSNILPSDSYTSVSTSAIAPTNPSPPPLRKSTRTVPPGLEVCASPDSGPLVCRLKKSLYGLRQASRQRFSKLPETLHSKGYIASMNDYSLFTKSSSGTQVVLSMYVDDILLAGNDIVEMASLKSLLDA
ncbi:uncharacterized protein [Nicotiana tomentosiformis]|uniref:uncharacterized protein n=1 Tax=Nicotiana tomentosiformis TaxID=4098 RepID=UPI00388CE5CB